MDKVKQGILTFRQMATDSMNQFPLWAMVLVALVGLACLIVHIKLKGTLVTPQNIRNKASEGYSSAAPIVLAARNRKSLSDYLKDMNITDPKTALLTNFYFSTVNATGLFFPANDGVYSPDAVRFAVQGGARAFVLDIWSSMDPARNFQPILHSMEEGSNWRRISMNSMAVETALDAIVSEVYIPSISSKTDYKDDVVLLYFRFHGGLRNATYDSLAQTCAKVLNPYKLDPAFSSCRGNELLFKTPITDFKGKVIVVTNKTRKEMEEEYMLEAKEQDATNTKNPLIPYINLCPRDSIPVEIPLNAVDTLGAKKEYIKNSIVFVVPSNYSKEATTNNWGGALRTCKENGIHCMAMNLFAAEASDGYADFLFKDYFATYSYRLKEDPLRILVVEQAAARSTGDTGVGTNLETPGVSLGNLKNTP
jgi:hypothetical protein